MRKVKLYIAMSLDGYIAQKDHNMDWLVERSPNGVEERYASFIKDIDTIVMGKTTYDQIVHTLAKDAWPYEGIQTYVFTHEKLEDQEDIHFVQGDICTMIQQWKQEEGKDIWICGGSSIIHPLLCANAIDRYHITILPVLLGDGIPLFQESEIQQSLTLCDHCIYDDIVELIYEKHTRKIRHANMDDLAQIMDIYEEAKQYMRETNNPNQWNKQYPSKELLQSDIEKDALYVVEEAGEVIGVFMFWIGEDVTYAHIEGEWLLDDPYGTIHRIAKRKKAKGVLQDALTYCRKQISHIRMDTHADNKVMQNALRKACFQYCGIIYLSDNSPRLAYAWQKEDDPYQKIQGGNLG